MERDSPQPGGRARPSSTTTSSSAVRWSPATDAALKATLRLHFQDLASTIRPRDWYTRHSLYWWLAQHYFPCTRTSSAGLKTCSLHGLVSQVHRTITSGLSTFVEANNVVKAPIRGTDKQKVVIGAANYLLLMAWKHCSLQSPTLMVSAGLTFPLFDIIYDSPLDLVAGDQGQDACAFTKDEFVGITSIEQIARYRLEWTEEGHEGFQYWMERFYELVEAGPLSTFLTSPDGRANKATTTTAEQQSVDDVPRERRDVALHALIQLHQDAERFMNHKREPKDIMEDNDSNSSHGGGQLDDHDLDDDDDDDEGEDYTEAASLASMGVTGPTKVTTRANKRRRTLPPADDMAEAMTPRSLEIMEEELVIGDEEWTLVDDEVERAKEQLLHAQARQVEVELQLLKARAAVRQARALLKIAQTKAKTKSVE